MTVGRNSKCKEFIDVTFAWNDESRKVMLIQKSESVGFWNDKMNWFEAEKFWITKTDDDKTFWSKVGDCKRNYLSICWYIDINTAFNFAIDIDILIYWFKHLLRF